MTPEDIRDSILHQMNYWQTAWLPTPGERGVVINLLERAVAPLNPFGGLKAARHRLVAFLFGDYIHQPGPALSTHALSSECWLALVEWAKPYKDDVDGWVSGNPDFETEVVILSQYIDADLVQREVEVLNELGFS